MRTNDPTIPFFFAILVFTAASTVIVSLYFRFKRRELEHRERMAALEKGAVLPSLNDVASTPAAWTPRTLQLRGLIWLFVGMGLTAFLFAMSLSVHSPDPAWARVNSASRAKENGATEEQIRAIMNDPGRGMPLGVALIGLIPMGVGLAYLITYRTAVRL